MNGEADHSTLGDCLRRFRAGEAPADAVLAAACGRLQEIAHRLKRRFPWLGRWVETDDVVQGALIRLNRALGELSVDSMPDFLRLSAALIRRELIDLARHFATLSQHHQTPAEEGPDVPTRPLYEDPAPEGSAESLAAWGGFHEAAAGLPPEQLAVFDLLWYHGLKQAEAAAELGVSLKTVKRRWQEARLNLHDALGGRPPE